ncbi:MAG: hypothetical protein UW25_C0004G0006 [Candidatus Nomurabacteria bacterium GW2011_GWB1_44_12]|uniref:Uncharacterized protein n=1 Tax=Candidatus Nomurabacteria bacterium GW2011_GWB1_44_12 TaxID=1618748 RepID=A0A837I7B0_9BACT|nr:MAG: hypothetical protein UW25_C0004G0006 [Candidatus Nomurabacteria bacterium GW2011_GWB1_44_12]
MGENFSDKCGENFEVAQKNNNQLAMLFWFYEREFNFRKKAERTLRTGKE